MRYAALLRGINVGGHNKVPMAELRALLTELGYIDLATHLQSGNAIFSSQAPAAALELDIAEAVAARFGVSCAVMVRAAPSWPLPSGRARSAASLRTRPVTLSRSSASSRRPTYSRNLTASRSSLMRSGSAVARLTCGARPVPARPSSPTPPWRNGSASQRPLATGLRYEAREHDGQLTTPACGVPEGNGVASPRPISEPALPF